MNRKLKYLVWDITFFLFMSFLYFPSEAQNNKTKPPLVSNAWLKILDREVRDNGGRIPVDTLVKVVVDHEGSGKVYSEMVILLKLH